MKNKLPRKLKKKLYGTIGRRTELWFNKMNAIPKGYEHLSNLTLPDWVTMYKQTQTYPTDIIH
jgi:hypothetical protein